MDAAKIWLPEFGFALGLFVYLHFNKFTAMGILSFGKSKNQGKVLLKEQPACYWEEESYMAVVPGGGMPDVSADAVGRVGVKCEKK